MAQAEADACENGDAASCSKTPLFLMLMIFMTLACVFFWGGGDYFMSALGIITLPCMPYYGYLIL